MNEPTMALRAAPLLIGAMAFAAVLLLGGALRAMWRATAPRMEGTASASLAEVYVFFDVGRALRAGPLLLLALALLARLLSGSWLLAGLMCTMAAVMPMLMWRFARKRRRARLVRQVPDALNLMAGSLRAGASVATAMDSMAQQTPAPLGQEIARVLREQRLGTGLDEAIEAMSRRLALEEVTLWITALVLSRRVGGNLAEILERLAASLRAKATLEGKIDALTSQGKLQGWVVGLLPLALAGVLHLMDPNAMAPLFTTPGGWIAMAVVVVMELCGALMIRRIVSIDV